MVATADQLLCSLYMPDGSLLATGRVHRVQFAPAERRVEVVVERPQRLLQECLIGSQRDVLFAHHTGDPEPAKVDRLLFDASIGRLCLLSVPHTAEASLAAS